MYNKVSTDLKFVEREKEVEKFWEDRQRQASHRPRADPRNQGHDSQIPDHEGLQGAEKSRLGHPRTSGGAGSGEDAGTGRQGAD